MAGISSKAAGKAENRFKFNEGTEINTEFDINLYETNYRSLDPQLGRFWQLDPMAIFVFRKSPYNFASDNPIARNDPLGLKDSIINGEHVDYKNLDNFILAPSKMRPKVSVSDAEGIASLLINPTNISNLETQKSLAHTYNFIVDRLSDGMPNPPTIIAPPNTWHMFKYMRLQEAKDFLRYGAELLAMWIPELNIMAVESEAVGLLIEEGAITREIGEQIISEMASKGEEPLVIQFGNNENQIYHTFRHTDALGLERSSIQLAIKEHFPSVISKLTNGKPLNSIIEVGGQRIQYTAFKLSNGTINIGRIHGLK